MESKGKDAKVLMVEGKQFTKEIAEKGAVCYALMPSSKVTRKEQFAKEREGGQKHIDPAARQLLDKHQGIISDGMPRQESSSNENTFKGNFLVAGVYVREDGNAVIASNKAHFVVYDRQFTSFANPGLPKRFELDAFLNKYDSTFYLTGPNTGPAVGYRLPTLTTLSSLILILLY
ncbi:hypothetical protein SUGI_0224270 [Cryptomeria japonica]|nr:hypothetical protein SUGI_0224270 [Cryptomeria japonica]